MSLKEKKNSKRKKRVTLKEIYLKYPHKWRNLKSNTIELPYFPASEITNNEYTLSYQDWKKVINSLLECYKEVLVSGNTLLLPHALGRLNIKKYRPKNPRLDFAHYAKTGEKIYHSNLHTDGYCPILYWNYRHNTHAKFKYKRHWSVTFVDTFWNNVSKMIQEDSSIIYNFEEV
jgi:nucleoid DNA-binding protein